MNILGVVDSASTIFRKKVRITLIHSETGEKLTTEMLDGSQLPEKFDKPTMLEVGNIQWRIVKFEQLNAGSYFRSPHICLHVISPDRFNFNNRYLIPTHASLSKINATNEIPQQSKDVTVSISKDEWLQLEFLSFDNLAHVQEVTSVINDVTNPSDGENNLLGYASSYKRETIEQYQVEINYDNFLNFLNITDSGTTLSIDNSLIEGGFSIQSDNYIYYGIAEQGIIRKLGVTKFDCVDEELSNVLLKYNLLFVDWCNASILSLL